VAKDVTVESTALSLALSINDQKKISRPASRTATLSSQIEAIHILNKAQTLPFDLSAELNLDTHLDNLPLMLHTERSRDIF